jgi:hypothetical protein
MSIPKHEKLFPEPPLSVLGAFDSVMLDTSPGD